MEAEDVKELGKLLALEKKGQRLSLHGRDVALVNQGAVKFLAGCEADSSKLENCPAYTPRTRSTDLERTIRNSLAGMEIAHNVFDIVAEWSPYEGKRGY